MDASTLNLLASAPTWVSSALAAVSAVVGTLAVMKKSRIDSRVAIEHQQNENTKTLMEQNAQLLNSIGLLREKLDASFARIAELNAEVVQLRDHIETLEATLKRSKEATP